MVAVSRLDSGIARRVRVDTVPPGHKAESRVCRDRRNDEAKRVRAFGDVAVTCPRSGIPGTQSAASADFLRPSAHESIFGFNKC